MLSHYEKSLAPPASPRPAVVPQPMPVRRVVPATPEAEQRRARRLALDKHRTATPTTKQLRRQLESREKSLAREITTTTRELADVRRQLAALPKSC